MRGVEPPRLAAQPPQGCVYTISPQAQSNVIFYQNSCIVSRPAICYSLYMKIISPAFANNGNIPNTYTCDGEDISPPLEFVDVPEETTTLVLIVEDPDAIGKDWVHWIVFNIDPHTTKVHEDSIPTDGIQAVTDFGHDGYGGPCPPSGIHRYLFKLYALGTTLHVTEDVTKPELEHAMEGHIIEKAELIGLYSRE